MGKIPDEAVPATIEYSIDGGGRIQDTIGTVGALERTVERLSSKGGAVMHFAAPEAAAVLFDEAGIPFSAGIPE